MGGRGGAGHAQSLVACCNRRPGVRVCVHVATHITTLFSLSHSMRLAPTSGIRDVPVNRLERLQEKILSCLHVCLPLVKLPHMHPETQH